MGQIIEFQPQEYKGMQVQGLTMFLAGKPQSMNEAPGPKKIKGLTGIMKI
jgi:hypothetical protein